MEIFSFRFLKRPFTTGKLKNLFKQFSHKGKWFLKNFDTKKNTHPRVEHGGKPQSGNCTVWKVSTKDIYYMGKSKTFRAQKTNGPDMN